ncbi:MAG: ABC transporter ATP-binding protein [Candidatus Thermoplasmatota archaeon]
MPDLRFDHVTKRYEDGFRFDDVSLAFPDGSLTVLLGPSGSGKSTMLRLLAGLEPPDGGHILLGGNDITDLPAEARGIGLVFQDGALFPHLNVAENVAFGLRVKGADRASRDERVREMLSLVGIEGLRERRIERLSGGERQRVALARALAPRPAVLLFDEPLASLDRNLREELRRAIRRLHDELRLTSVFVTHDREEALALADRLVLLQDGAVVEEGTPRDVFRSPKTDFAAQFLGSANVLDGKLVPFDHIGLVKNAAGPWLVRSVRFAGFHEEVTLERLADGVRIEARTLVGEAPPPGQRVSITMASPR